MGAAPHDVIIGNGSAGNGAARTLRSLDPDSRITIVTMSRLPFYNRYDLPRVFRGCHDWREILAVSPDYYAENRITLKRDSKVIEVNGKERLITFAHNEQVRYDRLLVCAGGRAYLPEYLSDYRELMHSFASFEAAMGVHEALPEGGTVIMLGGDMIGLDLGRTLVDVGYRVVVIADDHTFWPHRVPAEERKTYLAALERMGLEVRDGVKPTSILACDEGPARKVGFEDGDSISADVVMPFFGLVPSVEFMLKAGIDIERGLLVSAELQTTDEHIWAAGDVCQIWSAAENRYRFYYGWDNVRRMGEVAARNMSAAEEPFEGDHSEILEIDSTGRIQSPFWDY
jgi:NAD(P)H-nitrite reductase large subunit